MRSTSKIHPGYTPVSEIAKNQPRITRNEAMKKAARDAGNAAREREAAVGRGKRTEEE